MNRRAIICVVGIAAVSACGGDDDDTKTVTKTVEVVPAACLDALDDAEAVIGLAADAMDVMADGFDAASRFDADGLSAISAELNSLTPQVTDAKQAYNSSAAQCRATD